MPRFDVRVSTRPPRTVLKTIAVGTEATGCALSLEGTKLCVANLLSDSVSAINTVYDTVAKVYVTQFLAQVVDDARSVEQKEGRDDGREGRVTMIDGATDRVTKVIKLAAKTTSFSANGYLPNTASSPDGPVKFDVNLQAFASVIDLRDTLTDPADAPRLAKVVASIDANATTFPEGSMRTMAARERLERTGIVQSGRADKPGRRRRLSPLVQYPRG